ncbi:hypothetical protein B0J15DRAFT_473495, partial [Fusarium solani]
MTKGAKAAKTLKETAREIRVLAGKTHGNMAYAKRDLAWGKLDAKDLGDTFTLIRNVTIPMRVCYPLLLERNAADGG